MLTLTTNFHFTKYIPMVYYIFSSCSLAGCKKTADKPHPPLARHVIHIGVDGMDPCFVNSTSGAPNIMQRLRDFGASTIDKGRNVMPVWSAPNWAGHMAAMVPTSTGNAELLV